MTRSQSDDESARYDHYPDLTWHFGLSPIEIHSMPRPLLRVYINAIERLTAQEQLLRFQAAQYPKLKKGDQRSLVRKLERRARGRREVREQEPEAPKTTAEFEEQVVASGIEIQKVGPDGEPVNA